MHSSKPVCLESASPNRTVTSRTLSRNSRTSEGNRFPVESPSFRESTDGWMNKTGARVHRFFRRNFTEAWRNQRKGAVRNRFEHGIQSAANPAAAARRVWWKVRMVTQEGTHSLDEGQSPVYRCAVSNRPPRQWSAMVGTGTKLWTVMKIAQNHRTPQLRFGAAWAARAQGLVVSPGSGHVDDDPKWWNGLERGADAVTGGHNGPRCQVQGSILRSQISGSIAEEVGPWNGICFMFFARFRDEFHGFHGEGISPWHSVQIEQSFGTSDLWFGTIQMLHSMLIDYCL